MRPRIRCRTRPTPCLRVGINRRAASPEGCPLADRMPFLSARGVDATRVRIQPGAEPPAASHRSRGIVEPLAMVDDARHQRLAWVCTVPGS